MKRRGLYLFGALLLLAFAGFAFATFQTTLTPYVSYEQARQLDRTLQIAGGLVEDTSRYEREEEALYFTLREESTGETMQVRYHGLKPANFEEAISIVAIGRFDTDERLMTADKLLVKCPSKYQGVETKTYS